MIFKYNKIMSAVIIGCVSTILVCGAPAEAAVEVHDTQNIAENAKTAASTASTAINLAKQLVLDIQNIASMNANTLLTYLNKVKTDYSTLMDKLGVSTGVMNSNKSAGEVWNEQGMYDLPDMLKGNVGASDMAQQSIANISNLDKTYYDAVNISKQISSLSSDYEQVETALTNSANAAGIKEAQQASAQIQSAAVEAQKQANILNSVYTTMTAQKYAQENREKAEAIGEREQMNAALKKSLEKDLDKAGENGLVNVNDWVNGY